MEFFIYFNIFNRWARSCGNALELYPWGAWFESLPVHRPSLLRLYVVCLSLSREISGHYLNYTTNALFQNFSVTHLPSIQRYTALRYCKRPSPPPPQMQHICFNIWITKFTQEAQLRERSLQMYSYRCLFRHIFKNTSFVVIFTFL
jgi:hypothetical protein